MDLSRAALSGPFKGDVLPVDLPTPIDKPSRLAHWAPLPRMLPCALEALGGLSFLDDDPAHSMTLAYTDLAGSSRDRRAIVTIVRPGPEVFKKQLDLVAHYADLRSDRGSEILAQVGGGLDFMGAIVGLSGHRHKYTLELLDLAVSMGLHVKMRFKHGLACQRPVALSPQIQPMIPTPGHGALPSGHGSEAFMLATVLQALLPDGSAYREQLQRLAARVAVNRTVAGLHFPVDSACGRLLGTALGEFFVARCTSAKIRERGFVGTRFHRPDGSALDFDARVPLAGDPAGYYTQGSADFEVPRSPLLHFMWAKAQSEWKALE